ncbi:DNA gyrase inhibitor YacG [Rubrimonas cliftonensis]|uniref:DNA gyrase inhibitor YacG n=1 Tax=Rubrimonas cliftonensis TaxID=89524 RepID=UPI000B883ACC|nr:DNA gyrase inhibitor YacG [Rubrimonas cliftonensis]
MAEAGACPICGQPRHARFRPFCSRRCADLDLVKWLKGDYAAPGEPVDEGDLAGERSRGGDDPRR